MGRRKDKRDMGEGPRMTKISGYEKGRWEKDGRRGREVMNEGGDGRRDRVGRGGRGDKRDREEGPRRTRISGEEKEEKE